MISALIAALYFGTGYFGLYLNSLDGFASLIWFPTGVAIASVYLAGYSLAPVIFASAFLVNYIWGGSVLLSLTFACGNTLEAVGSVWLLRRLRFEGAKLRLSDVWKYMLAATVVGPLLSAGFGLGGLVAAGMAGDPLATFGAWWLGNSMGSLVLGFAILIWRNARVSEWVKKDIYVWLEGAMLAAFTLSMLTWLFVLRSRFDNALPVSYFFFPLVIWCAVRFGHPGVTLQTFALVALGTWGTLHGWGLFAGASVEESLTYFQSYLWMVAAMGLVISSILRERDSAVSELQTVNENLDTRIQERTGELVEAQHLARIGSWEWDVRTNVIKWSDELYRIHGLPPGGPLMDYQTYLGRIHPDDRHTVGDLVERVLKGDDGFIGRRRIIREDGEVRVMQARGRGIRDANGAILKLVGTTQDITEIVETENELRRMSQDLEKRVAERTQSLEAANRAKDDFLAVLSHELRTPLNVILGWTESLIEGPATAAAIDEGVRTLRRNALVQKNLIDDLLDTSRIIAGKLILENRDFNLVPLVRELSQAYKVEASKRRQSIIFQPKVEGAWVHGDPARIHQVVSNLLSNAVKFSLPGGVVDVGVEVHGGAIRVWVKDAGVGIDPEFISQVFDRFRQESRGTNRQHEGLGLGLAICQYLINRHGGAIVARSEGKGRGASFEFELPLVSQPLTAGPSREKAVASAHLKGKRVLLIDDAPDILDLLSFWLKKHAIEVMTAGSVADAFAVLESYRPDVIFCDIGMPGEDGYAFIARLKGHTDAGLRSIPVAALTAYTEESERIKTLQSGFDRHMIKPVTLPRLLDLMTEMLEDSKAGRELNS